MAAGNNNVGRNLKFGFHWHFKLKGLEKKYSGSAKISYILRKDYELGKELRGSTDGYVTFFLYMQLCDILKPEAQVDKVNQVSWVQ